jgi:hypothetical protein
MDMVVLLSAPRGRISAARLAAAHRDEREEAYGIIIRPPLPADPARAEAAAPPARPWTGGEA